MCRLSARASNDPGFGGLEARPARKAGDSYVLQILFRSPRAKISSRSGRIRRGPCLRSRRRSRVFPQEAAGAAAWPWPILVAHKRTRRRSSDPRRWVGRPARHSPVLAMGPRQDDAETHRLERLRERLFFTTFAGFRARMRRARSLIWQVRRYRPDGGVEFASALPRRRCRLPY